MRQILEAGQLQLSANLNLIYSLVDRHWTGIARKQDAPWLDEPTKIDERFGFVTGVEIPPLIARSRFGVPLDGDQYVRFGLPEEVPNAPTQWLGSVVLGLTEDPEKRIAYLMRKDVLRSERVALDCCSVPEDKDILASPYRSLAHPDALLEGGPLGHTLVESPELSTLSGFLMCISARLGS